jgi:ABC-type branched-subunit amino acid transport system ATPase component/ABC-type branched-subunit amino acid transport system permease subunit
MSAWYHAHQAIIAFSLVNILLGLGMFSAIGLGLISLAGAGFMAAGAYAAGVTATRYGVGYPETLGLAMLAGGLLSAVIALPVIRLRSHYFAIATLAFSLVVSAILVKWAWVSGGSVGFIAVPLRTTTRDLAIAVVGAAALLQLIFRSETGRVFRAIRSDEYVCAISGVRIRYYKFLALTLSGILSGLAGGMYAQVLGVLQPSDFREGRAFAILSYAVFGGAWHWSGSVLGALILTWLPEYLRVFSNYRDILTGCVLLGVVMLAPGGLVQPFRGHKLRLFLRKRRRSATRTEPAATETAGGEFAKLPRRAAPNGQGMPVCEITGIRKRFGGVHALSDVALTLPDGGGIYGLIGPNGSGKTTLLNVINGFTPPDAGSVLIRGDDLTSRGAASVARAGVARSFQDPRVLAEMSVFDNVLMGCHPLRIAGALESPFKTRRGRRDEREAVRRAQTALATFGLEPFADHDAGSLSFGQRRLIELARISVSDPALVILDEPTSGVNPVLIQVLSDHLRERRHSQRTAYLVAEHNIPFVMELCDFVFVMEGGKLLAQGAPAAIQRDERVLEAYLGANA